MLNDAITVPEGPDYVARSTALARGTLRIDEVADSGDPRQVRVSNTGSVATLFLFGEEVLGAKKNRVANASFLIGAHDEAVLDVSCPEADRCVESCSACIQRNDGVVSFRPYKSISEWVRSGPFGAGADDVRVLDDSPQPQIRDAAEALVAKRPTRSERIFITALEREILQSSRILSRIAP